jgi:cyclopropane fatty-acyl-phospholipid synthase-like methyltransferase
MFTLLVRIWCEISITHGDIVEKKSSPSAQRNKEPILDVIKKIFSDRKDVLEIGAGTGEHAAFFSKNLRHLTWTACDRKQNHRDMKMWIKDEALTNLKGPYEFEIGANTNLSQKFDAFFLANVLHIMSWKQCKSLFKILPKMMKPKSKIVFYGPFNKQGKFTSESNEQFDHVLKKRDPQSGIRHLEDIATNMAKNGFFLTEEIDMPANNKILFFEN